MGMDLAPRWYSSLSPVQSPATNLGLKGSAEAEAWCPPGTRTQVDHRGLEKADNNQGEAASSIASQADQQNLKDYFGRIHRSSVRPQTPEGPR